MDQEERRLMLEASIKYYIEGLTQNQIAKQLYVSRPKVSRLLKKARELNIVDIKINYPSDEFEYIKNQIMLKFKIKQVIVTKSFNSYEDTLNEIGKMAAFKLMELIKNDMTIGISWGKTVRSTINHLPQKQLKDLKIVELFGAFSYENEGDMLSIGGAFASKMGAKFYPIPSPVYVPDKTTYELLTKTPIIKQTLEMISNTDIILSGIGAIDSKVPSKLWSVYMEEDMRKKIKRSGGIGFLCAHYFDKNGKFLKMNINDYIIGIKTNQIINHPNIILVAGGEEKALALLAMLKGGYINTLISDQKTLELILKIVD
ncbi:sugar-binding transcriptional regulator [Oceanotoga teriensis]|uniref:sugar-binding transcriptional regulator n=1 Tax=Oceanotoga teriensis TaxID=515440 RepID=UPI00271397D1|nr:sugar-binding transcriptional regulator [Oceanotoga teriensis]MDO7976456.1 sugar-binding transcriptional regulator [Oceanotoga teriensis]